MTQRDAFDDLADAFGTRLQRAEARRAARRPRLRRLVLAGGGLALAGSAAALVVGIGAGSRLDVVSEARAALEPAGTILHVNYVSGRLGDPHNSTITDTWVASDPLRWRFRQQAPYYEWKGGTGHKTDGYQIDEYAFADGVSSAYAPRQKRLDLTAGYSEAEALELLPPMLPGAPAGVDPIGQIRGLLESGNLRAEGAAIVDGRKVRRLRGVLPESDGVAMPAEYDVDAETFAPVRVRLEWQKGKIATIHFTAFERLRTTPQNLALLASDPAPGTDVRRWHQPVEGQPCEKPKYESRCRD